MTVNISSNPYFDDFNEDKNFHKVLYKPGFAVQARELTQMQTILQEQIARFGKHVFKDGSIVLGGQFNIDTAVDYVKITNSSLAALTSVQLAALVGKTLTGTTSEVQAYVVEATSKTIWGADADILLVRYLKSGTTFDKFSQGEELVISGSIDTLKVVSTVDWVGKGSLFSIDEGVVFSRGYFVKFSKQNIILHPTSQTPTCQVGFDSNMLIITASQDESLLDNAQGSYNFAAPGADRLAVIPTLVRVALDAELSLPDFVFLFSAKAGELQEVKERTEYGRLMDTIAKRTFDESGDYIVRGFGVRTREHLNNDTNNGYLFDVDGGDPALLVAGVEAGVGYVKGYEINNISTKYLPLPKSSTYVREVNETVSTRGGNYIYIEEVLGLMDLDEGSEIELYDTPGNRVSAGSTLLAAAAGDLLGTARVKGMEYNGGGVYRLYLFDIKMTSTTKTFSDVRAVTIADTFFADPIVGVNGKVELQETFNGPMVYQLGSNHIKTLKNDLGDRDTTYAFRTTTTGLTVSIAGVMTESLTSAVEAHAYGNVGFLSRAEKESIHFTFTDTVDTIDLPGTIAATGTAVTGTSTFFTRLAPGDQVKIASVVYTVATVTTNTAMTLVESAGTVTAGTAYKKHFRAGSILDLSRLSATTGVEPTVEATFSVDTSTLSFDIQETFAAPGGVKLSYIVYRQMAIEIGKTLKANKFVRIDVTDATSPIGLGISDVYKIRSIRLKTGSTFTTSSEGTDVTAQFSFDNGQRDDMYDHATITPLVPLTPATDYLLINLDYFEPDFSSGVGYFSIDSYDIDDVNASDTTIFTYQIPVYRSKTTGGIYDLRNHLDFRPVKSNTAADSATVAGSTQNPAVGTTFATLTGLRLPLPDSQVTCDMAYYLARRDVVTVDKDGIFTIIQGVPAVYPVTSPIPESSMGVAELFVPPYPSLSSELAKLVGRESMGVNAQRITHARHTMREIGVLKQRIDNLEYYASLSLLETAAADMKILDENGLDRFKNGFFVDGFADHSLGATTNPDYKIAVDKEENVIRPIFELDGLSYSMAPILSTGVQKTGNLITLPYTQELLLEQSRVTTYRNIEQSVFRFVGNVSLIPATDTWVDTTLVDKTVEFGNDIPSKDAMTTTWGSWTNNVTGYNVYARSRGDRSQNVNGLKLVGTYSSYAEAQNASKSLYRTKIETVNSSARVGTTLTTTNTKESEELGAFVTDVSLIPYIKPQNISIKVTGLKANTVFFMYFDSENMSSYVTPITTPTNTDFYTLSETSTGYVVKTEFATDPGPAQVMGAVWRSDAFGVLVGTLTLPITGKRFRVGTKEVRITDSPTNAQDATSHATGYFFASGLNVQKQNTIVSTMNAVSVPSPASETIKTKNKIDIFGPSCMAYSFKVDAPEGEYGVFMTSVEVFIAAKHATLGAWFEIREMDTAGGITRTQVPYSEVWYKSSELTVSADALTPHVVTFPSPVFLMNDTQYALVIHTEGLNPDTYFWVSRLGEKDIITGNAVTGRQLTGSLYTTNNNLNWDIVPDVDLKVRFKRAKFSAGPGSLVLGNAPYEFLNLDAPLSAYVRIGEVIAGSQTITLSSVIGVTPAADYSIVYNAVPYKIVSVDGPVCRTLAFGIPDGAAVTFLDDMDVAVVGGTANVASAVEGLGYLEAFNPATNWMKLRGSNGKFFAGGAVYGTTSEISTQILSFDEWDYSVVNVKPHQLTLPKTQVTLEVAGSYSGSTSFGTNPYYQVSADSTFSFTAERSVKCRSYEMDSAFNGSPSAKLRATLESFSEFVSPVFDAGKANSVYVHNIINDDATGEDGSVGGNLLNKYISKTVTLADGQDAEDLRVDLTAYIPPGSSVMVWAKLKNGTDGDAFEIKPWVEMIRIADATSSPANLFDFKSFTFNLPASSRTGVNGEVQYTANGNTYTGFKQFSIKIGLLASNNPLQIPRSSLVPRVGDLQAIALQI